MGSLISLFLFFLFILYELRANFFDIFTVVFTRLLSRFYLYFEQQIPSLALFTD